MLVPLGKSGKFAIVDDDWEEDVLGNGQKWYLNNRGYAITKASSAFVGYKRIFLHKLIMGEKPGFQIDHINGDRLDNRTANLRFVTVSQQAMNSKIFSSNTSGCKGVSRDPKRKGGKWRAYINRGERIFLGYFQTLEEARVARKEAEKELHGEYIRKELSLGYQNTQT